MNMKTETGENSTTKYFFKEAEDDTNAFPDLKSSDLRVRSSFWTDLHVRKRPRGLQFSSNIEDEEDAGEPCEGGNPSHLQRVTYARGRKDLP